MKRAYCEIFVASAYVLNNGDARREKASADKKIAASLEMASPEVPKITAALDKLTLNSKELLTLPHEYPWQNRILKGIIWNDAQLTLTVTDSDKRNQALVLLREVIGGAVDNLIPSGINFFTDSLYSVVGDEVVDGIEKGDDDKTKTQIIGTTPKLFLQLTEKGLLVHRQAPDGSYSILSEDPENTYRVDLQTLSKLRGNKQEGILEMDKKHSNGYLTLHIQCHPLP